MKTERFLGSKEISCRNEDNNFSYLRILQNFVFSYAQAPLNFTNVGVFNATYSFSTILFRLRYIQNSDGIKKIAKLVVPPLWHVIRPLVSMKGTVYRLKY